MSSEAKITFKSYVPASFKRKNMAILRSIYAEIMSYFESGCTRDEVYKALTAPPYNMNMTKGSYMNALQRIKTELKENPLSSGGDRLEAQANSPASVVAKSPEQRTKTPNAFSGIKVKDTPNFKHVSAPNLEDLLGGNEND